MKKHFKLIIIATLIICGYESLTKGWYSLALIPAAIVVFPTFFAFQYYSKIQLDQNPNDKVLKYLSLFQLLSFLTFYLSIPAVLDTNGTILFGFLPINNDNSWLANASQTYANIDILFLIIITVVLLFKLVIYKKFGDKVFIILSAVAVLIIGGLILNNIINQQYYCDGYIVPKQVSQKCGTYRLGEMRSLANQNHYIKE